MQLCLLNWFLDLCDRHHKNVQLCFLNWLLDLQKYLKIYTGSFFYWFPIFFEESVSQKENFCGKSSRMGPPLKVLKSSESGVKTSYSFYAAFFWQLKASCNIFAIWSTIYKCAFAISFLTWKPFDRHCKAARLPPNGLLQCGLWWLFLHLLFHTLCIF